MPTKTGPKRKLTSADEVRIRSLIAQGRSDSAIADVFGVSRTTILRVRHFIENEQPAPVRENALEAFIRLNQQDWGPCDDAHLDEYCARRDAAFDEWRRAYPPEGKL